MSAVEAVARAICKAHSRDPDKFEGFDAVSQKYAVYQWMSYIGQARAAIEALAANVTDEMLAVHEAFDGEPVTDTEPSPEMVRQCHAYFAKYPKQLLARRNAMAAALRAALSDGQKGGG